MPFQSTQPEWAATQNNWQVALTLIISIHAARVGCDQTLQPIAYTIDFISIHAARVGCDRFKIAPCLSGYNISIHAARVGCDYYKAVNNDCILISIHAARVGCDKCLPCFLQVSVLYFNPRSPSGLRQYKNKL